MLHHALCDVIEPLLSRRYIDTSFACLKGRGAHRAILRHGQSMTEHRYLLQLDVMKYFPSIPHARLLDALSVRIRDEGVLWLCSTLLASDDALYLNPAIQAHLGGGFTAERGRGLPVGYLCSQVWGNFYLDPLDHFVKRTLKVRAYQRYMDNLTLFADSRAQLRAWEAEIRTFLRDRLDLSLREDRIAMYPCSATVEYLGYRVSRSGHSPARKTLRRVARLLELSLDARTPWLKEHVDRSISSYSGMLRF